MSTTSSQPSSRNATRRLIKELETWHNVESKEEKGIERLGPVSEGELLAWEAVINGRGVGAGYDGLSPPPHPYSFPSVSPSPTDSLPSE
jgi:peroxin-4